MKVVHIESGLGNQMLSYCEYLVLKKLYPNEDIYIETMVYDIPQCNEVIKQWNGYELEHIFGIQAPNIKELFSEEQWKKIMTEVRLSEFWEKNWNYPVYITNALKNAGLDITNIRGDFELKNATRNINMKEEHIPTLRERIVDSPIGDFLKRHYRRLRANHFISRDNCYQQIFYQGKDNVFTGQWLGLKMRDSQIEFIEKELRKAFKFKDFSDTKNIQSEKTLSNCNSVAIHARRGDMLGCNGYCYKYGYFRRAISYIKQHVKHPVFVFFCDPGSIPWCKENAGIFNLDFKKDQVLFIDWNKGTESYRDMQLMTKCKHNVITNSSFGWWGAYLNQNPNKITISPLQEIAINTTIHC